MRKMLLVCFLLLLAGCTGYPEGAPPVSGFELDRYLGRWYEIARLDHRFERGLSQVTAHYQRHPDGGLTVLNRGYNARQGQWSEAQGRAYFVGDPQQGHLKVSFFGPFYSSYVIFGLDKDYQYAFVAGPNHDYLWLLSRQPTVSDELWQRFIDTAQRAGFDTQALIRL